MGCKVNPLLIEASFETSSFEGVRVLPFALPFLARFNFRYINQWGNFTQPLPLSSKLINGKLLLIAKSHRGSRHPTPKPIARAMRRQVHLPSSITSPVANRHKTRIWHRIWHIRTKQPQSIAVIPVMTYLIGCFKLSDEVGEKIFWCPSRFSLIGRCA